MIIPHFLTKGKIAFKCSSLAFRVNAAKLGWFTPQTQADVTAFWHRIHRLEAFFATITARALVVVLMKAEMLEYLKQKVVTRQAHASQPNPTPCQSIFSSLCIQGQR
ncbi:bcl-2-related protein A1 [Platysternon megacephalum]|uniref:Bcl-2-related protein A1 n=1 Tax=Platysternon megacephalum TaxID=55544 RepID=A0A4D9EVP5_9SAUR|nr:bcl-2-related protein A1 [Platysternon megacephalum]